MLLRYGQSPDHHSYIRFLIILNDQGCLEIRMIALRPCLDMSLVHGAPVTTTQ